jgi:hypothetical protein
MSEPKEPAAPLVVDGTRPYAIKLCLDYLAQEAERHGMQFTRHLIRVAAMGAMDELARAATVRRRPADEPSVLPLAGRPHLRLVGTEEAS